MGGKKANLWNNEISCITNTVDLPNVQTIQNVRGNLLRPDVALRHSYLNIPFQVFSFKVRTESGNKDRPSFDIVIPLFRAVDVFS